MQRGGLRTGQGVEQGDEGGLEAVTRAPCSATREKQILLFSPFGKVGKGDSTLSIFEFRPPVAGLGPSSKGASTKGLLPWEPAPARIG